jgi:hypothetical protein
MFRQVRGVPRSLIKMATWWYAAGRWFEVDSADAARRFLQGDHMPEDSIRRVWTAIALHTTPGIPVFMEPEVALVTAEVEYDVLGIGYDDITASDRAEITARHPRPDFNPTPPSGMSRPTSWSTLCQASSEAIS